MSEATLAVRVLLNDGARAGFDALGLSVGNLAGQFGMLHGHVGKLDDSTKALLATTAAAGLVFAGFASVEKDAIAAAGNLDQEMSKVNLSVTGATDASDQMRNTLIDLADQSIFSTSQIAEGFAQMGIDGWNATQIMNGMGDAGVNLAEATRSQTGPAFNLLATAMEMYGADASQATQYSNDLTFAFYNGQKSVTNLQQALNLVGPTAHLLHVPFGELMDVLALLGEAGLKGGQGASSLNYYLTNLSSPTSKAAKELKALGVSVYDSSGNFIGLTNTIKVLGPVLDKLSEKDRAQAISNLFNVRSGRDAREFFASFIETVDKLSKLDGIRQQTSASKDAATAINNWNDAVTQLKSTWVDTLARLGGAQLGPLRGIINGIWTELHKFNTASPAVHSTAAAMLALGTASSGAAFLGLGALSTYKIFKDEIHAVGRGFMGMGSSAVNALSGLSNIPFRVFDGLAQGATKFGTSVAGLIDGGFPMFLARIQSGIFSIGPTVTGFFKSIPSLVGGAFQAIPGILSGMGTSLLSFAGAALPIIGVLLLIAGAVAIGYLYFTHYRDQGMQLVTFFKGIFGPVFGGLAKTVGDVATQVKISWALVGPEVNKAMTGLTAAIKGAAPFFQFLGVVIFAVGTLIIHIVGGIVSGFFKALPAIITVFTGIFQVIGGITKLVVALFTGQWGKIPAILGGIVGGAWNILSGGFMMIWNFIGGVVGGIISWFTHLWDKLVGHSIIPDMVKGILSWFLRLLELPGVIFGLVVHLIGTFMRLEVQGIAAVLRLVGGIMSKIGSLAGDMKDAAGHAIDMFVQGILGGIGKVGDAVGKIAGKVKGFLGFHSPPAEGPLADSDEYMPNMMHMFATDITKHTPLVHSAVQGAASVLSNTISLTGSAATLARAGGTGTAGTTGDVHNHIYVGGKEIADVVMDGITRQLKNNGGGRWLR